MIKVKNLTKYFGNIKVLDNVSFEIKSGEICGFIGENGAGKSTTMKILATEILDYEGQIIVNKKVLSENIEEIRTIIGFMPDQYGLYDDMTLSEYLVFNMLSYNIKPGDKKIEEILEKVFLLDKIDDKIGGLSRGMTQRICLARALVLNPKILILDEPASGLDPRLRIELKKILLNLKKEGITIFVSSHILLELGEYCDKIIFINNGKITKSGTIENLRKETISSKIYLSTGNNKKALKILKKFEVVESIIENNNKLEIDLKEKASSNDILNFLLEEKVEIIEFNKKVSNLEDIYMDIIK